MNRTDRTLAAIAGVLALSVLVTGGLALYLTLVPEARADLAPPPAGPEAPVERIAYVSDREGDTAVYTMANDGSDVTRLSPASQPFAMYPSWAPDGRLAYVAAGGSNTAAVWVITPDGTAGEVIGELSNFGQLAWSPDGTRIALTTSVREEKDGPITATVRIYDSGGTGLQQERALTGPVRDLRWSPDGRALLVLVSAQNYPEKRSDVIRAEGGELLLSLPGYSAADWLPDGTLLYADSEARQIFRTSLDGEAEAVAELEPATVEELLVSPDGSRALLTLLLPYGQYPTVLSLLDVESGAVVRLVEEDGWLGEAAWSPDSSRILYTRGPFRYRSNSHLPYANLHSCDIATGNVTPLTREEGFAGLGVWGSVPDNE